MYYATELNSKLFFNYLFFSLGTLSFCGWAVCPLFTLSMFFLLFFVSSCAEIKIVWFSVWMDSHLVCALLKPLGSECMCYFMYWCHCTCVLSLHFSSHAHTQVHTYIHWAIGFARVLHRSASLDSSLKCPWQLPNAEPSFPLFSCIFSSSIEPLMDAAIYFCLSLPERSHTPSGPVMQLTICIYPIKCHFVNEPVSPHSVHLKEWRAQHVDKGCPVVLKPPRFWDHCSYFSCKMLVLRWG